VTTLLKPPYTTEPRITRFDKIRKLTSDQQWWIGLGLILIPAAILRFTGFTYGLPYFDHMDEPWLFYEAAYQRGLLSYWLHPNPSPGLITMFKVGQIIAESITGQTALAHVTGIITVFRIISIIASLITLIIIGFAARELAGNLAGWLASAVWSVISYVIYHSFIAIAEPWMMLFGALALLGAIAAMQRESTAWATVAVCGGLFAFAFKYSMFPFVGIGLFVSLWHLMTLPLQRRKWLKEIVLQIAIIVTSLWLLTVFAGLLQDVTNPGREVAIFLKSPLERINDLGLVARVLNTGFALFSTTPAVFVVLYGIALGIMLHQRASKRSEIALWIQIGSLGAFSILLIPLYLMTDATIARYTFAADLVFVILAASAVVIIYDYFRTWSIFQQSRSVLTALLVIIAIIWIGPLVMQSVQEAYLRTKQYTLTDLTVWASHTLGAGNIITEGLGNRAFNREFGGYTGLKRIANDKENLLSKSPEQWQKEGYQFVELAQEYEQTLRRSSESNRYLNQLLELRRFPPPDKQDEYSGPAFIVYQLKRPETPLNITFQDTFKLIGCDGLQTTAVAGSTLTMQFYWQAAHTPPANFSMLIHLQPYISNELVAQADGAPGPVNRPTQTWNISTETLVSEPYSLNIPAELKPGQYRLYIGLYNISTGERLLSAQGDRTLLTMLTVSPKK
jgi:hypothetical protein